jgi:hypothetical protein
LKRIQGDGRKEIRCERDKGMEEQSERIDLTRRRGRKEGTEGEKTVGWINRRNGKIMKEK